MRGWQGEGISSTAGERNPALNDLGQLGELQQVAAFPCFLWFVFFPGWERRPDSKHKERGDEGKEEAQTIPAVRQCPPRKRPSGCHATTPAWPPGHPAADSAAPMTACPALPWSTRTWGSSAGPGSQRTLRPSSPSPSPGPQQHPPHARRNVHKKGGGGVGGDGKVGRGREGKDLEANSLPRTHSFPRRMERRTRSQRTAFSDRQSPLWTPSPRTRAAPGSATGSARSGESRRTGSGPRGGMHCWSRCPGRVLLLNGGEGQKKATMRVSERREGGVFCVCVSVSESE